MNKVRKIIDSEWDKAIVEANPVYLTRAVPKMKTFVERSHQAQVNLDPSNSVKIAEEVHRLNP